MGNANGSVYGSSSCIKYYWVVVVYDILKQLFFVKYTMISKASYSCG